MKPPPSLLQRQNCLGELVAAVRAAKDEVSGLVRSLKAEAQGAGGSQPHVGFWLLLYRRPLDPAGCELEG